MATTPTPAPDERVATPRPGSDVATGAGAPDAAAPGLGAADTGASAPGVAAAEASAAGASAVAEPAQLAAARGARGWSTADVASKLGMTPRQIDALERGDWAALPGQAFVRGAIRAYGKVVQLDVTPLLGRIGDTLAGPELRPAASLDAAMPRRGALGFDSGGSGSRLAWLALVLLGLIALAMYFGRGAEWLGALDGAPAQDAVAPAAPPAAPGKTPGVTLEVVPVVPPPTPAMPAARDAASPVAPTAVPAAPAPSRVD